MVSINLQETNLDPDVLMFKNFLLENKIELMPKNKKLICSFSS